MKIRTAIRTRAAQDQSESTARASRSAVPQPPREDVKIDLQPAEAIAEEAGVSVADQPFAVSKSVAEACKPAKPGVFRQSACDRANHLLAEMAREPRDEPWATVSERVLRAYAEQEPGKFSIRALECRKSICFIETASIFGHLPDADFYFVRDHGFSREDPVDVHETDEAGARLTVTLLPVTRR